MDDQLLSTLRRVQGVVAAYLVDANGVVSEAAPPGSSDAQGKLLAAMVGALRQAAGDLALGDLGEVMLEAAGGAVMAGALPGARAAVVLTDARANLGMVRVELRRLRRSL